jgi:peptidylprolyl isomerase
VEPTGATLPLEPVAGAAAPAPVVSPKQNKPPPAPLLIPAPPDVAAPPKTVARTPSGLASRVLRKGAGTKKPTLDERITFHYTGWTVDGKAFDSSVARGAPETLPVAAVPRGISEGVKLMTVGEKRRFWIPEELGFRGAAGQPQGTLIYDVELLAIVQLPETPTDVAAPADATTTASGLAYMRLIRGRGKAHPTESNMVEVRYSGWTPDGKLFDSSLLTGKPATLPLAAMMPGWTEGLALMVAGDKMRFWIPAALAYASTPDKPQGMLVYDIELIRFW